MRRCALQFLAPNVGVSSPIMSVNNFQNSIGKPLGGIGLVLLWFSIFAIPLVEITTCTQGSEDAWAGSLIIFLPLSCAFLGLAWLGTANPSGIKWLSLPLFILLPWACVTTFKYIWGVTLGKNHLCVVSTGVVEFNSYSSSWWAVYWGPLQLIFILLVGWCLYKYWQPQPAANKAI